MLHSNDLLLSQRAYPSRTLDRYSSLQHSKPVQGWISLTWKNCSRKYTVLISESKSLVICPLHFRFSDYTRWTTRLADICAENGLVESRTHRYHIPLEISILVSQIQLEGYAEVSRVALDNSQLDSKGPRFRELIEKAHKELNKRVLLDHKLEVTVARKAS